MFLERKITDHCAVRQRGRRTVLHLRTAVAGGGGADKTTLKSPFYLRRCGIRAAAVYLRAPGDGAFATLRARAKEWRCPLFELPDWGAFDVLVVARLYAVCRRLGADILHAHEYKTNVVGLLIGRLLGLKLVSTVHGWVERSAKLDLFYRIDRLALRYFDRVVAVSPDLYDACVAAGIDRDKVRLVHNAIEVEQFRRRVAPDAARQRWGGRGEGPSAKVVIGAVGRLSEEKGLRFLIEAFGNMLTSGVEVELWIAGEGKLADDLKQQAAGSGAGDRIVFLGHVSDTVGLFECFDVFCLPSLREGLPNVLLEALAMEVAVVATPVGGIAAVLHDGVDARLVAPEASDQLTDVLSELVNDAGQRRRLAAAGRALVETEFSFETRMQRMVAIYNELDNGQ